MPTVSSNYNAPTPGTSPGAPLNLTEDDFVAPATMQIEGNESAPVTFTIQAGGTTLPDV